MALRPLRAGLATAIAVVAALGPCWRCPDARYNTAATATTYECSAASRRPPPNGPPSSAPVATPVPTATPTPSAAARGQVRSTTARTNTAAQLVLVSVTAQHAWMCQRTRVV